MTLPTPSAQTVTALADTSEFQVWKTDARRDDWHQRFVGSDIRQLIGEVERLTSSLAAASARIAELTEALRYAKNYIVEFGDPLHAAPSVRKLRAALSQTEEGR